MDTQKIEAAVKMIIEAVGEDANREGLQETPARVARMYQEIFSGLGQTAEEHFYSCFNLLCIHSRSSSPSDRLSLGSRNTRNP